MKIEFKWEHINSTDIAVTSRAKVPGGWLVNIFVNGRGGFETTTNFVSDPEWAWEIDLKGVETPV